MERAQFEGRSKDVLAVSRDRRCAEFCNCVRLGRRALLTAALVAASLALAACGGSSQSTGDTQGSGDTNGVDIQKTSDTSSQGDATTADTSGSEGDSSAVDTTGGSDTNQTPDTTAQADTNGGTAPVIAGCTIFPADNPWNTDISKEPVDPSSAELIAGIGNGTGLHPDFGTVWQGAPNGIPYVVVDGSTPLVEMHFDEPGESEPGPYPIPADAPIEGGPNGDGDRHVLVLRTSDCKLFEAGNMYPNSDGSWDAFSGAIFDLSSNALRKDTWTSADAAGLPILPGLVKYDEVASGEIKHALRFTVGISRKAFVHPGTHWASDNTDANRPPMGMRVRLKASFDISGFSPRIQVILKAMKTYGMFVADNGSNWYVSGAPDSRWDDDELATLSQVKGSSFEVVKMGKIYTPADF